jgi:DNA-binding IclR family transcriptional regulator
MEQNLLSKGIDVLEVLRRAESNLSFQELHRRVRIPKTTLYRILKTLIERDFVIYEDKKYKLGYGFLSFTKKIISEISLREIANPYLKKICQKTEET